jgi:hypothetical protein
MTPPVTQPITSPAPGTLAWFEVATSDPHRAARFYGSLLDALVANGEGAPFAPAGKVFREWVSVTRVDRPLWQQLLSEAAAFARDGLAH